jgi:hypothetical protein
MGRAYSAYGWKGESCTVFWWENLGERDHWGDPGADGRIILKWIFRKWDVGGLDRAGLGCGQVAGTCECGNEPSGSRNVGNFLIS